MWSVLSLAGIPVACSEFVAPGQEGKVVVTAVAEGDAAAGRGSCHDLTRKVTPGQDEEVVTACCGR